MARKRTGQDRPRKGTPGQRSSKSSPAFIVRRTSTRVNVAKLLERSRAARSRALHVLADLRRDPALTFTQATQNRNVDRSTIRKYISTAFRRDDSGRVKARPSDRFGETLFIPGVKPDEQIFIRTKNSQERQLVGRWHTAFNAAAKGDFSLISTFPKGQMVDGVLLPTGTFQIQKILAAQTEAQTKLEGPYRTLARPS